MKIKCDFCGSYIDDTDEKCSNCGGVNSHLVRAAIATPKTIEELKTWCKQKNIPLQQARFYIGENYKGARAFGIYKDEGTENFIVYKNKSDGSRAVRYEGKDEAYAVNEIYQKLKEEMLNQKQRIAQNQSNQRPSSNNRKKSNSTNKIFIYGIVAFTIIVIFAAAIIGDSIPNTGYYYYGNDEYYYQNGDGWYRYNSNDWEPTEVDDTLVDNYSDYYESQSYDSDYNYDDFSDSSYYQESSSSDSSSDSDSDWDSGWDSGSDWDSGSSDWDSDW